MSNDTNNVEEVEVEENRPRREVDPNKAKDLTADIFKSTFSINKEIASKLSVMPLKIRLEYLALHLVVSFVLFVIAAVSVFVGLADVPILIATLLVMIISFVQRYSESLSTEDNIEAIANRVEYVAESTKVQKSEEAEKISDPVYTEETTLDNQDEVEEMLVVAETESEEKPLTEQEVQVEEELSPSERRARRREERTRTEAVHADVTQEVKIPTAVEEPVKVQTPKFPTMELPPLENVEPLPPPPPPVPKTLVNRSLTQQEEKVEPATVPMSQETESSQEPTKPKGLKGRSKFKED